MRSVSYIAAFALFSGSALITAGCGWSPKAPAPSGPDKCGSTDAPAPNVVTAAVYSMPAPPSGKWTQIGTGHTSNCALYWVQVGQINAAPDSPQQVLFFHKDTMVGTPTPNPRPYLTVTPSTPDTATVQFQWQQAKDQPGLPTGIGSVRYTLDGGKLKALDPIPGP